MSWESVGLGAAAGASLMTALAALLKALRDRRAGISSDEREAIRDQREDRRDTIADRDAFLATVLAEVRELRARVDDVERRYRLLSDHADALEHHIYTDKGPPPPARPDGI